MEEARYMDWYECEGLVMPRPPSLVGSANRAQVSSLRGCLPISAGIKVLLIHCSSGSSKASKLGMDLHRKENLWTRLWVNAAYAACGWALGMSLRKDRLFIQVLTFSLTNCLVNSLVPRGTPRYSLPLEVMVTSVSAKSSLSLSVSLSFMTSQVFEALEK